MPHLQIGSILQLRRGECVLVGLWSFLFHLYNFLHRRFAKLPISCLLDALFLPLDLLDQLLRDIRQEQILVEQLFVSRVALLIQSGDHLHNI